MKKYAKPNISIKVAHNDIITASIIEDKDNIFIWEDETLEI